MQKVFIQMMKTAGALGISLLMSDAAQAAVKDQSRLGTGEAIGGKNQPVKPDSLLPGNLLPDTKGQPPTGERPDVIQEEEDSNPSEPYDINNIPALERIELTLDIAKRAIDAFADIGTRYDDKGLYDYPTLKEFAEKTEAGKQLESDVKKYGFRDVEEWNVAIMNVSFAFGALLHDQEKDIRDQIAAVKENKDLSAAKKQRVIASLNALIPSKENIKIIEEMRKLPEYQKKLDLLDAFE